MNPCFCEPCFCTSKFSAFYLPPLRATHMACDDDDDEIGGRNTRLSCCCGCCYRSCKVKLLLRLLLQELQGCSLMAITRTPQRVAACARAMNPHNPGGLDDDCKNEACSTRNYKNCVASPRCRLRSASESPRLIRASLVLLAPSSPSVMSSASAPLPHAPAEQLPSSRWRQGVELTWNQHGRQVKSNA
jgi:hypothetical protein